MHALYACIELFSVDFSSPVRIKRVLLSQAINVTDRQRYMQIDGGYTLSFGVAFFRYSSHIESSANRLFRFRVLIVTMKQNQNNLRVLLVVLMLLVVYVVYVIVQDDKPGELLVQSLQKELRTINEPILKPDPSVSTDKDIYHLIDIQSNEEVLKQGRNIFFILTTLTNDGTIQLTPRQACAIESAARANPDWKVFPLFVFAKWFNVSSDPFIPSLLRFCNIRLRHVNLETFAVGSPVEKLFTEGALSKSSFIVEHTADVLRLLTLYKYGGTYLDTDVVVRRTLNILQPNYLGSEGSGYVANGVINLEATGYGHEFAEACLKYTLWTIFS